MANDNQIQMEFVIDDKSVKREFKKIESEAEKSSPKVGDALNKGLGDGKGILSGISGAVIGLNQGLELAKKAFDAVGRAFDTAIGAIQKAEALKQAEKQFEFLSVRAGVAASVLENDLVRAANGLVGTSDLIQIANRSLIELGDSAQKLPQLFDVARKSSLIFGGDVKNNLELINNAISSGNSKSLKAIGLYIDQEAAVKKYASSLGVSADRLSLAGRQQAILNAVLEKGQSAFSGIDDSSIAATNSFTRFKVQLEDAGETISTVFTKAFGGIARGIADIGSSALEGFNKSFSNKIGDQISDLESRLQQARMAASGRVLGEAFHLEEAKKRVSDLTLELKNLKNVRDAMAEDEKKAARLLSVAGPSQIEQEDPAKVAQMREQISQAILSSRQKTLQGEIAINNMGLDESLRVANAETLQKQQLELIEEQHQAKLREIRARFDSENVVLLYQRKELEKQLEIEKAQEIEKVKQDNLKASLEQQKQMIAANKQILVSGISSTIQAVAKALVAGTDAWTAFKDTVLGIIGDMLIRHGEAIILQSAAIKALNEAILTFFPAGGFAAGAALIALGGVLKAQASSAMSSAVRGDSGGGGVSEVTSAPIEETQLKEPQTQVQVVVNGDVFDTEATGLRIVDILNQSFDQNGTVVRGAA